MTTRSSLDALPGGDLVAAGLRDLEAGVETVEALLVAMAAPRLRATGIEVPADGARPSHRLYRLLATENPATAHSRYNALVARIVSFARAVERARAR
jgi:hypothetical protein